MFFFVFLNCYTLDWSEDLETVAMLMSKTENVHNNKITIAVICEINTANIKKD